MDPNILLKENFNMKIQTVDRQGKTLTCVIVSGKTNRGKRKIDIQGCRYDDYMRSPVVLAFHDDERIIARCVWLKFQDEGIIAKFEFRDSPLANDIFTLYKEGFLTSWSIGFLPHTWNYEEEEGVEIIHITQWTLLEVSAVSIPMDSNAITIAIGQGIVHDEYLIQSVKPGKTNKGVEDIIETVDDALAAMASLEEAVKATQSQYVESLNTLRDLFDKMTGRFEDLQQDIQTISQKVSQEDNSINIIDFTDFTKDVKQQVKLHIDQNIRGRI
ncbi:MAG: HK97 family phage prohead protease [Bacteroidota bacterium]|nr:HK97 family phage prohead protease [Bacteroidota bacterium]